MSKIRIYIKPGQIEDSISITDRDTTHKIKDVLRLKAQQPVYVFDGCGKEYLYSIKQLSKKSISLTKEKLLRQAASPANTVTLGFPLEKEDRVDFILQKCTELGVFRFIPFISQRSLKVKPSANKLNRWQRIIIEAARQSQRLWIPEISETLALDGIDKQGFDLKIVGSLAGQSLIKKINKAVRDVLIVIGPVGDFSQTEYKDLNHKGFKAIKLSENLLRTETAAMFSVGLINNFLNEG
ncbi:MAG: 16S rRNA (uracil(1498)-N(3))-methyltransferase [Candidatus Omnitrophica bacterium]|nr:16S rRNA (uracil(1498)-N(3))-methyltransferase [Candidatus Omnitrophota bacterium]MBU2043838.1 16S rRNA (uracil(1498)-N(3))-methyltransferase [Candidatus Omnitrophota bacterium]MBU2266271.1 16S rRNA (uracil(1498)-N(3))-methyltransferase [Candidatus Omnitrophota bacterium]